MRDAKRRARSFAAATAGSALAAFAGAAFAALVGYEAVSVALARFATPALFARYEAETDHGAKLPPGFSRERIETLLRVRDPRFWTHGGVDWSAPLGGTLAQSVTKKLYFVDFKPGFGRIRQTLIAQFAVGALTSKSAQIAAFIDVNGFDPAARKWFGKPLAELDDGEFLALVVAVDDPKDFAPGTQANAERVRRIEKHLAGLCERRGSSDVWLDDCGD
ncbi:transglycosylase domain-containing protein [Methylosinus sp. RM1]|uniref:transglycosylase domain-containing protein n=1 Tax=Methylosinus sp. RM1 TaxID=2583817 RepID=UPI00140850B0|nr:transglycosylase domain-containing protein [Methylosinus sp. RM1]